MADMASRLCQATGWRPDLPDRRDYTPLEESVAQTLKSLPNARRPAVRVDWRKYCGPALDQLALPASAAHAAAGLVDYFVRRTSGRLIQPSRLFLYQTSRRLSYFPQDTSVGLRDTFKVLVRLGVPPERVWPYELDRRDTQPDAFTYAAVIKFPGLQYVRLDPQGQSGGETLAVVKAFVAAGFACAVGMGLFDSISNDADIPFPTLFDAPQGGHAVVAVGYDDNRRIRSDKGALLIRNSWGADWGDAGYGWLPYSYVRERLAVDLWTLLDPQWLDSGEFARPRIDFAGMT
jgi:C1A family cysteine protease